MRFRLVAALLLSIQAVSTRAQHCVPLLPVSHGQFKYANENQILHEEGSSATLLCDPGAVLSGHTNIFRCHRGQWTPPVDTKCLKLRVDSGFVGFGQSSSTCNPLNIANGNAIYSALGMGPFPEGTSVMLACNLGFAPMGKAQARCENGQWTNIGLCQSAQSVRCAPMLPVPNGQVSYHPSGNGPYDYGAVAQLNCNLGYTVVGANTVTCEPTGWGPFPGLGSCQKGLGGASGGQCPPVNVQNGMVMYLGAPLGATQYPTGSSAIVTCTLGYQGGGSSFCQGGTWTPPPNQCNPGAGGLGPLAMPGATTCFAAPMVLNGNLQYNPPTTTIFGPFNQGTTATVQCNQGFQPQGATQTACQNGVWQPATLGTCNPSGVGGGMNPGGAGGTQCLALTPQMNGQITYSQQGFTYPTGTTATFQCNQGSQLNGAGMTTCQDGQWQPQLGQCTPNGVGGTPGGIGGANQCPFPMPPPFGGTVRHDKDFGPYAEGSVATAQCNSGTLQGPNTATCRQGMWNPSSFPMCTGGGLGGNVGGLPTATSCLAGPMAPFGATVTFNNGAMFGPFNEGTTASVRCNDGRPVQGASQATCQNGQWNPQQLGTCDMSMGGIGGTTGAGQCIFGVPPPFGGQVEYQGGSNVAPYNQNTQAILRCNQGYQAQGTTQTTCQNGMWNPPMLGTCNAQGVGGVGLDQQFACYSLAIQPNGEIRYNPPSNGKFQVGATASLECNPGFSHVTPMTATCTAGGWNNLFLGSCQQSGGQGNPNNQMGSCQFAPPQPQNGRIEIHGFNKQPPYPPGTLATVVCDLNFLPDATFPAATMCQNGQWVPSTLAQCSALNLAGTSCFSGLPNVNGGRIRYSNNAASGPFPGGTTAELQCNQPGVTHGAIHASCVGGSWNPPALGTCSGQLLNSPASPVQQHLSTSQQCALMNQIVSHGVIEYSDRFNPTGPFDDGVTAALTCHFGYVVQGSPKAICQAGVWQPDRLGECQAKGAVNVVKENTPSGCPPMQLKLSDGYLDTDRTLSEDGIFPHGTAATLQCKGGYSAQGEAKAACRNGRWEPSLGSCEKARDSGSKVQTCQALVPPFNGRISYIQASNSQNYQLGTTAILNCELGYVVDGQAALSCTPGGWQPQPGFGQCRLNNEIYG